MLKWVHGWGNGVYGWTIKFTVCSGEIMKIWRYGWMFLKFLVKNKKILRWDDVHGWRYEDSG